MVVVHEEELHNTIRFIQDIASGVKIIMPRLGDLNGGCEAIKSNGLWALSNVYADTALAASHKSETILSVMESSGYFFCTDFPFGDPKSELKKVLQLNISVQERDRFVAGNIIDLMATSNISS